MPLGPPSGIPPHAQPWAAGATTGRSPALSSPWGQALPSKRLVTEPSSKTSLIAALMSGAIAVSYTHLTLPTN